MNNQKEHFDKLVGEKETRGLFDKFENLSAKYKGEIETLKFLYKNVQYNKFRFLEEFNRGEGWKFDENALKKLNIGKIEIKLPITVWQDILYFELNSFFFNVIRTINFCLELKLKKFDNLNIKKQVSIAQFISKKEECAYKNTLLFEFIESEYIRWISKINELRNKIVHENIVTQSQGYFNVSVNKEGESYKKEEEKILSIPSYDIDNLEDFVKNTNEDLSKFLKIFLEELNKSEVKA